MGTLIKIKNTGSSDLFNARLLFGVMKLRDAIIRDDKERLEFDKLYNPVLENLEDCIESKNELVNLINKHKEKVRSREIIAFQNNGNILEVKESINRESGRLFKDFFIKGEIAMKSLQYLTKKYNLDFGFFFQKEKDFKNGINFLKTRNDKDDGVLVETLTVNRPWHNLFNEIRRKIEHEGFSPGDIKYRKNEDSIEVLVPKINDKAINEIVEIFWENVFHFVEDIIAITIDKNLKDPMLIVQIPKDKRDPSLPIKYTVGLKNFVK